jgi:hypothetical protein
MLGVRFLNFVLAVVIGSFVSSCAVYRDSPKRVVSGVEFLKAVEEREFLTDDCRSMYCHYYLKIHGDSIIYLKGEAGRLIVENLICPVEEFSGADLLSLNDIDSMGVVGLESESNEVDLKFNEMLNQTLLDSGVEYE